MTETPNDQLKRLLKEASTSKGKRSRMNVGKLTVEGVHYDSKAEHRYAGKLDMEVRAGLIKGFDFHVPIPLIAEGGELVGHYEADFIVWLNDGGQEIRDIKSPRLVSDLFSWKARHVKAQYKVEIVLISSETLMPFTLNKS